MSELIGTWKLQQYKATDEETGNVTEPFGSHPNGYASYGPDARMYALIVFDNRTAPASFPPTDAESAALLHSMVSYAGAYTVEQDKVIVNVDVSWNHAWTGTTQIREFSVEGNRMTLRLNAVHPATGRRGKYEMFWTRVEAA